MTKIRTLMLAAAATASLAGGLAVHAQTAPAQGQVARPAPPPGGPMGPRRDPARRIEALKTILKITPAQEGAFKAWTDSMRPPERGVRPAPAAIPQTAPARIDAGIARAERRVAMMKSRGEATKRLYAQLSPDQQKTFDSLPLLRGGDRRGPGRHGRRGPDGHRMGPPPPSAPR